MRRFILPAVGSIFALLALMPQTLGQGQSRVSEGGHERKLRVLAVARTPLADEHLPDGGLIIALLAAGLKQSGATDFADLKFDVRWTKAGPAPPVPGGPSIDIVLPVGGPDCDHPNDLTQSLAVLCDNAIFSDPMLQVVVGLFAPSDSGFKFDTDEDIFGKTICVVQDHDVSTLNGGGRNWVSLKRVTVLRRAALLDCVTAVQGRVAHAFAATDLEGRHLLGRLGLTKAFRMQARPFATRGVHAVVAREDARGAELIGALNRGLERLKRGDAYAAIVQKHLMSVWDGPASVPQRALATTPPVPTPAPGDRPGPLAVAPAPVRQAPAKVPSIGPEDRERALRFMKKGDDELDDGRVAPARLLYERAAEMGLARAAMALAGTYDAVELAKLNLQNVQPDAKQARRWYERALSLGAKEASERLQRLGP